MARVTVDLISSKEFSLESRGYNRQEVDNFLDDICEEMERMDAEIKDLRQKTTVVKPAAPAVSAVSSQEESSFREILEMAKKVKDDTIQKAREDAEAIRVKAETEARHGIQARMPAPQERAAVMIHRQYIRTARGNLRFPHYWKSALTENIRSKACQWLPFCIFHPLPSVRRIHMPRLLLASYSQDADHNWQTICRCLS